MAHHTQKPDQPLAARIRPDTLAEFVGQEHLTGPGGPLREALEKQHRFSFVLWGPPGTGKTTLARMYARALGAYFHELSAVSASKDDIKRLIREDTGTAPNVLFLDEIHRFNKAQQDFLLPYVESGEMTLIGATTENPSFEVIAPLLSRCRVFPLYELSDDDMVRILQRTGMRLSKKAREWLVRAANGDARHMLTVLENAHALYGKTTLEALQQSLQDSPLRYDKAGDEHYNTISALIKSMRAGQPDAAVYYLARMVEAGDDPKFIARRLVIFASEDIGLAQPTALVVANEVFRAVETVGLPEAAINLAHGVAYLAGAQKDRSAYDALRAAQADVQKHGNLPIPMQIRNAPTTLMKNMGYGEGYEKYTTDDLLPQELKGTRYFPKRQ